MSMNAACVYMLAHSHKHCLKPVVTAGRKRTSKLVTIQTPQDEEKKGKTILFTCEQYEAKNVADSSDVEDAG